MVTRVMILARRIGADCSQVTLYKLKGNNKTYPELYFNITAHPMNNHKADSKIPNITYQAGLVYSFVLYNASNRENITSLLLTCR